MEQSPAGITIKVRFSELKRSTGPAPSLLVIFTPLSLHQKIDVNDYLIVVDITGMQRDGWLPKKAWDWITANEK